MVSEEFLYEYIRNSNKFKPTYPVPFINPGVFYDVYIEELMNWITNFYAEARGNDSSYGGKNADPSSLIGGLNGASYAVEFSVYYSEDLFHNVVPQNATLATLYIPEVVWYNPSPRTLDIQANQDTTDLIYSVPFTTTDDNADNKTNAENEDKTADEVINSNNDATVLPTCQIASSDLRFFRLYIYDIGKELINAIDYKPTNMAVRESTAFPLIQAELVQPQYTASITNKPVDLDLQAVRPYIGFTLSLYDRDVTKDENQHLAVINLIDLINNKSLDRNSYYSVHDVLDLDGVKFNYTKVFYDLNNKFIFIGKETGANATPGVLITTTGLVPISHLVPIGESFHKLWFYNGISEIQFLSTDNVTIRRASLPDFDLAAESGYTATYSTYTTYTYSKYRYNASQLTGNEEIDDYIFDHYILPNVENITINCATGELQSIGGFKGTFADHGVYGMWDSPYPHMLMDSSYDIYCFQVASGSLNGSCTDTLTYGYNFALIGHLLSSKERKDEQQSNEQSDESASQESANDSDENLDTKPFLPKSKKDMNPYDMNIIEDKARIPAYSGIFPDPRRLWLWGTDHPNPAYCFGLQELIYASSSASIEFDRRIASAYSPDRKQLLIIGDPYTSKGKWQRALRQWNSNQNKADYIIEEKLLLAFNGLTPAINPKVGEDWATGALEWSIETAGRARSFASLQDDDNPLADGHTKLINIANFHDPIFVKVTDRYRERKCPQDINKLYANLDRRERHLQIRVWPRTLPCINHLDIYKIETPTTIQFGSFSKEISDYPIWGPFPSFLVTGLRSYLEVKITDDSNNNGDTHFLDMFINGYYPINEFAEVGGGMKTGIDFGISFDFDSSVVQDDPFSHMQNDLYTAFNGTETTTQWQMYMWGKEYGISTLNIRDYAEYHQSSFTPVLHLPQRDDLLNIQVYLWKLDNVPSTIGINTTHTFQIKGIVSHPLIWLTSDSSIASIVEDADPNADDDSPNDQAGSAFTVADGNFAGLQDQMDNGGPTATLTVKKAGAFRIIVMDSARIPFVSSIINQNGDGTAQSSVIVVAP